MIAHEAMDATRTRALLAATAVLLALLVLSGWHPYDRATWAMEVAPVVIALPLLWGTYRRFPLTTLVYACIFVHALVLMLGGAYTYARVPLGFQIAEVLGLHRNPYDKIGHFFQGFAPALIAREILIRGGFVRGRKMLAFIVVCIVLAISATYEFIEWGAALALGQGADEFLGTQGDPWDTQSDMFFALLGAIAALVLFSRVHDRQIRQLDPPQGR
jgi:putative membrane protein